MIYILSKNIIYDKLNTQDVDDLNHQYTIYSIINILIKKNKKRKNDDKR